MSKKNILFQKMCICKNIVCGNPDIAKKIPEIQDNIKLISYDMEEIDIAQIFPLNEFKYTESNLWQDLDIKEFQTHFFSEDGRNLWCDVYLKRFSYISGRYETFCEMVFRLPKDFIINIEKEIDEQFDIYLENEFKKSELKRKNEWKSNFKSNILTPTEDR